MRHHHSLGLVQSLLSSFAKPLFVAAASAAILHAPTWSRPSQRPSPLADGPGDAAKRETSQRLRRDAKKRSVCCWAYCKGTEWSPRWLLQLSLP